MADGKSSPFTGGQKSGGTFDLKTGTGPSAGGKAPPFDQFAQKNPQRAMQQERGVELGGASGEPSGGMTPFADIAKSNAVNPERAKEHGVGSLGNSQMPFRLNGAGAAKK